MILSTAQRILVAQLIQSSGNDDLCYRLATANEKTVAMTKMFDNLGLIQFDPANEAVRCDDDRLSEIGLMNGIVDETGELSEEGASLATQQIREGAFFKLLKSASS